MDLSETDVPGFALTSDQRKSAQFSSFREDAVKKNTSNHKRREYEKGRETANMTTIESKEEISDTDSGIILHSGPDSPTSPVKELTSHTKALKLKQQSLEDHLELCLLELRKLCIREAELTGKLPSDYPLMPEEKPPRVRRRIGASFKLDEGLIQKNPQDSELQALETDLALQQQIYEAARKLSLEEKLSKPQKKSRLLQFKKEEKKVMYLQEAVFQHRIKSECNSPRVSTSSSQNKDLSMSDDSSLSDVVALDDDVDSPSPLSPSVLSPSWSDPPRIAEGPISLRQLDLKLERSPIQNSPWKESSLDQPYLKISKARSLTRSRSSSPAAAQVSGESCRIPLTQFVRNSALRNNFPSSAPSTPELLVRRQYSQSFRLPKRKLSTGLEKCLDQARLTEQRCTPDFKLRSPDSFPSSPVQSSSVDSSSGQSPSHISSPLTSGPTEIPKLSPPPYGFHFGAQRKGLSGTSDPPKTSQPSSSPELLSPAAEGPQPLSQDLDKRRCSLSAVSTICSQNTRASSPRSILKPPPPYTRVVRTPSLREYPNHAVRLLPREIVSEELKSWHQRNKLQKFWPPAAEEKSAPLSVSSPTSPHLPPFNQGSGNLILQRAADGTPLQWFVAEDAEIVSQV